VFNQTAAIVRVTDAIRPAAINIMHARIGNYFARQRVETNRNVGAANCAVGTTYPPLRPPIRVDLDRSRRFALQPMPITQIPGGTMSLRINAEAPDFTAQTTEGPIRFHEWIGDSWAILFSHPKNFTPVCTTELGYAAKLNPEFAKRNCKLIGLSVDHVDDHKKWLEDIEETQGHKVDYPIIGDFDLNVAKLYDMLPADDGDSSDGRTAAANATVRTVFLIGPDKKIKLMLSYPMSTGRNFDEILRVLDSVQLTAKHKVATPVNWKQGDDVIIVPAVSDEEAKKKYPGGWKSPKPYLRIVPQPRA
jgi:alkyl hydroperoxide reductase subunit AhpC